MNGAIHSPGRIPRSVIAAAASFMPAANFSFGVQSPTSSSQPSSIWTVSKPSSGSCGTILSRSARETVSYSEYQDDHTVPGSSPRTPYRSASRSRYRVNTSSSVPASSTQEASRPVSVQAASTSRSACSLGVSPSRQPSRYAVAPSVTVIIHDAWCRDGSSQPVSSAVCLRRPSATRSGSCVSRRQPVGDQEFCPFR
jgi:hypothetical protein